MTQKPTVCVMGLGYIGLPTASLLATQGFRVRGVEVHAQRRAAIAAGQAPISEPDLDVLVRSAVLSGFLTAAADAAQADVFILAVPTPFRDGHKPDLSYVENAARAIAPHVQPGNLVILESTSPVGTTEKVRDWVLAAGGAAGAHYAHCPERVLPGRILIELVDNDRIVGGVDVPSTQAAADFYGMFVKGKVLQTHARTAELAKLTENSYRDVNIAFANELSLICHELGIDVWELIRLANHHPRVNILQPGPGVGGHCIAVDPWFIVDSAPQLARLIRTAREVNDAKPHFVVEQVRRAVGGRSRAVVACLGLAYKADIDDLRESPSVHIVEELARCTDLQLLAVEPYVKQLPAELASHGSVRLVDLPYALQHADAVVLLTNHRHFAALTLGDLAGRPLIDTRGQLGR